MSEMDITELCKRIERGCHDWYPYLGRDDLRNILELANIVRQQQERLEMLEDRLRKLDATAEERHDL